MSVKKEFVLKALGREAPMVELCREYGISRKTGYKWIDRFQRQGLQGLVDESRRPLTSPLEASNSVISQRTGQAFCRAEQCRRCRCRNGNLAPKGRLHV